MFCKIQRDVKAVTVTEQKKIKKENACVHKSQKTGKKRTASAVAQNTFYDV